MRGIVINPYIRKITPVEIGNDIQEIYRATSWESHVVKLIQIGLVLPNGDNLLVDEEGLLGTGRKVFKLNGVPFVGCAILLGSDHTGEWCDCKFTVPDMETYVSWTNLETQ